MLLHSKLIIALLAITVSFIITGCNASSKLINHPSDGHATIQDAINSLESGGTLNISPGVYNENITITNKIIHISGTTKKTVLNGQGVTCIELFNASGSSVSGLTIINGIDGIITDSIITIKNNVFFNNGDGVDYKSGGGLLEKNTFHLHQDDAIDLDDEVSVQINNNIISSSKDDGIEIRLNSYTGANLPILIHDNTFKNNAANGIQIIDYETLTSRTLEISNNTFIESGFNEIAYSDNQETIPTFDAGTVSENITIAENIFYPSFFALTGSGDNTSYIDNIIYATNEDIGINSLNDFLNDGNTTIQVIDVYP